MRSNETIQVSEETEISRTCDFCGVTVLNNKIERGDQYSIRALTYDLFIPRWREDDPEYETYDVCEDCWATQVEPAINKLLLHPRDI